MSKNFKIIKRIRRPSPDPRKVLRLNRNEYGDNSLKKKNYNKNYYYPDSTELIKNLAKFNHVKSNTINVGLGADSLIKDIFFWHRQNFKSRRVAFNFPNYFMYEVISDMFNYKKFKFNINLKDHNKISSNFICKFLKLKKISLLIIVNPSSPIEKNWSIKDLKKILSFCAKKNIFVLIDEIYYGLGSSTSKNFIKKFDNVIILRSFSKAFGLPGIRVAYSISNENTNKKISSYRPGIELPADSINTAILSLKRFKKNTLPKINQIISARGFAHRNFKKRNIKSHGSYGNSISFELKNKREIQLAGNFLKSKNILVNYNYPKKYSNIINITTTNIPNLKLFFTHLDFLIRSKRISND